jgi:hypothetical protein
VKDAEVMDEMNELLTRIRATCVDDNTSPEERLKRIFRLAGDAYSDNVRTNQEKSQ